MEVLVSLLVGLGVALLVWAWLFPQEQLGWPRFILPQSLRRAWDDRMSLLGHHRWSLGWFIFGSLAAALGAGWVLWVTSRILALAGLAAVLAGAVPWFILQEQLQKARRARREAWPHFIDSLIASLRAGYPLGQGLAELALDAPPIVRGPLAHFAWHYRTYGSLESALENLKIAAADPVADRICEAIRLAHLAGGGELIAMLEEFASMLRQESRARAEISARTSWTVAAARLAAAAPWLVLALLFTREENLEIYRSATGSLILVAGAGITVLAYRLMLHLGRIPENPRVLRSQAR